MSGSSITARALWVQVHHTVNLRQRCKCHSSPTEFPVWLSTILPSLILPTLYLGHGHIPFSVSAATAGLLAPDVQSLLPQEGLMLVFATTLTSLQLSDIHGRMETTLLLFSLATAPAIPKWSSITGIRNTISPGPMTFLLLREVLIGY